MSENDVVYISTVATCGGWWTLIWPWAWNGKSTIFDAWTEIFLKWWNVKIKITRLWKGDGGENWGKSYLIEERFLVTSQLFYDVQNNSKLNEAQQFYYFSSC